MGKVIDGIFVRNEVTAQEEMEGRVLGDLQRMLLQNDLADFAQTRLNLTFDPANHLKFIQDEAALASKIVYIQYLLECSNTAYQYKLKLAQEK